jgi:hypothetical protein
LVLIGISRPPDAGLEIKKALYGYTQMYQAIKAAIQAERQAGQ